MSRLGTGLGFARNYTFMLGGGSSPIVTANVAELDGTNHYSMGNPASLQFGGDRTVLAWVKPSTLANMRVMGAYAFEDASQNSSYLIAVRDTTKGPYATLCGADGNGNTGIGRTILETPSATVDMYDGEWHLVGFTYEGTSLKLWADASNVASATHSDGIRPSPSSPHMVGAIADGSAPFQGGIHSSAQFNRAITQGEWDAIWNGGQPKCFTKLTTDTPSLSDAILSVPLFNHTGFVGQETANQGTGTITITAVNSPTYTESAEIEC